MDFRFPQGSASTVLSLAAGAITASAVALAWIPLLTESEKREVVSESAHLSAVTSLGADWLSSQKPTADTQNATLTQFLAVTDVAAVWLVQADGTVVAAEPEAHRPSVPIVPELQELCAPSDGPRDVLSIQLIGEPLRAACAPLTGTSAPLSLVVLNEGASAGPLGEARRRATFLLFGVGALVGLVVIGGIRWLLAPIQEISQAAGRIAMGVRSVRVSERGPEEIAQLARAVNALASSVETREDEIRGRLEVVNEISSMVAHEIRNPLQSLELLSTLARTERDEQTRNHLLTTMAQEIRTLEGVAQRVLRSSGPLRIAVAPTDLVAIVHRAASMSEPEARKRKVALLVRAPGALRGTVDGSLVRRAFENLLHNAIEFAAQNPPGQVTAELSRKGDRVRMVVEDDGPGVPPTEVNRIFQPYYSSKSGGTGLGLALCKQVFEAHGGSIRYEPSPLGGARFVAELPLEVHSDGSPSAKETSVS